MFRSMAQGLTALAVGLTIAACVPVEKPGCPSLQSSRATTTSSSAEARRAFRADREAILAMAGNYRVSFDFRETVSLTEGYKLKDPKLSGGFEVVRVLEDTGRFISLQHTLLVGPDSSIVVKHWRQDWVYEPREIWDYKGHNGWKVRRLSLRERKGKWAQLVYQVDDSPRYAALARWNHHNGESSWTSPATWRPLPRRDATTRNDYDVIVAVNRHALTPTGWVHEQDNSKLVLDADPHYLVREIGVNNYVLSDEYDPAPEKAYWEATGEFWQSIRQEWTRVARENRYFALTVEGESEAVYMPILGEAQAIVDREQSSADATQAALTHLRDHLTFTQKPQNMRD